MKGTPDVPQCGFSLAVANEQPLVLSTNTLVTEDGKVCIHLTLENSGQRTLYEIQPMIHFHHTMAMMSKIAQLNPGQKITLENKETVVLIEEEQKEKEKLGE